MQTDVESQHKEEDAHPVIYFLTFVACLALSEIHRLQGHATLGFIWGSCGFAHLYWCIKLHIVRWSKR